VYGHSIYIQVSAVATTGPYTKNEASAYISFIGSLLKSPVVCFTSKSYGEGPFNSKLFIIISDRNFGLFLFRAK
jgi:hypothetical protein